MIMVWFLSSFFLNYEISINSVSWPSGVGRNFNLYFYSGVGMSSLLNLATLAWFMNETCPKLYFSLFFLFSDFFKSHENTSPKRVK